MHKPKHNSTSHRSPLVDESVSDYHLFVGSELQDRHPGTAALMDLAFGRSGNDRLLGLGMDDDLLGGSGNDRLDAGDGHDHLDGGAGNDWLVGGDMADLLMGGAGNDHLDEGAGHGDLNGGPGNDTLVGGLGADAFAISPDSGHDTIKDFVAGPGMFDHLAINGLSAEDLVFEDTAEGVLISWSTIEGAGSVLLEGVAKTDLAQDDFMFADDRHLIVPTGANAEEVTALLFAKDEGGNLSAAMAGSATAGTSLAEVFDEFNVKFGTSGADSYEGTASRDYYLGLAGNDQLFGGAGDDHLGGDEGDDVLDGSEGHDDLRGGEGGDSLYGGDQADNLMGESGNDTLAAGAGHDMLDGGTGDDILHGGDGADAFIVSHGSGHDTVIGGFDAGPGAFDHVAFVDVLPSEVVVSDTTQEGIDGVLISWGDGSIFLQEISKSDLSQDDFMFNSVEGGAFVDDPAISMNGTYLIFQETLV